MIPDEVYKLLAEYLFLEYEDMQDGFYKFTIDVVRDSDKNDRVFFNFCNEKVRTSTEEEIIITKMIMDVHVHKSPGVVN